MKRPILMALAILLFGTTALSGCFYAGPGWYYPDHDDWGWGGRHYYRRGMLTPPHEERMGRDDRARPGHESGSSDQKRGSHEQERKDLG